MHLVLFDEEINRAFRVDRDTAARLVSCRAWRAIRVVTVGQGRLEFQVEGLAVVGADVCNHSELVIRPVTTTDVVLGNLG